MRLTNAAVVAHDAGGAEILSSLMRRETLHCLLVSDGPAMRIFASKVPTVERTDLADAINQCDWLLCGTGWQSELELDAIDAARAAGKRSVAFLDHWVNYRERFIRGERVSLPDEIWVGDHHAEKIAREEFSEVVIRRVNNPYFDDVRMECAMYSKSIGSTHTVLYVCEPISEHALRQHGNERHWGYVEEEALTYFLTRLPELMPDVRKVLLRPHPSESQDKYDWALKNRGITIVRAGSQSLLEEISQADMVAGCESMALVIGILAKKRVVSCIPEGGKTCSLPYQEIEYLRGYR